MKNSEMALIRLDIVNSDLVLVGLIVLYSYNVQDYFEHLECQYDAFQVCKKEYCAVLDDFRLGFEKNIGV